MGQQNPKGKSRKSIRVGGTISMVPEPKISINSDKKGSWWILMDL